MTAAFDLTALVRRLRREACCEGPLLAKPVAGAALHGLLPHRPPFLFLDSLIRFNRGRRSVTALRRIAEDDPVFAGHFPENPIYPGALQLEIMAQAGTCLLSQRGLTGNSIAAPAAPPNVVGTRVHHALFLSGVRPGETICTMVGLVEDDGLLTTIAGQIWVGERLCAIGVLEAHVYAS